MRTLVSGAAISLAVAVLSTSPSAAQIDSSRKSPVGAGALSYLFPGAGSLYAGNNHHAAVHAAVGVATYAAVFAAMADPCTNGSCRSTTPILGLGGFVGLSVNSVWSIVTAVRDANAHNAAVDALRAGDSTAGKVLGSGTHSLFGLRGVHLGLGGGVSPYLDQWTGAATSEGRFGVTLRAFPDWTFAYAHSSVTRTKSTDYFVRGCNEGRGCYPRAYIDADAFELQRRWHREHRVHPIAAASVGSLVSRYSYDAGSGIAFEPAQRDSTQYRQFASVGAGLEADVWGWFHAAAYGGYRQTTRGTVPNGKSSNSGPVLAWLVEIGKF